MPRDFEETITTAIRGASILSGERESCAVLARLVGVGRGQPGRWRRGARPRRGALKRITVLIRLCRAVEAAKARARQQLGELDKKD